MNTKPVLFTSLDGTIREPHPSDPDDVMLLSMRDKTLQSYCDDGYAVIGVMNPEECPQFNGDISEIHRLNAITRQSFVEDPFSDIHVGPPKDASPNSLLRKPNDGLLAISEVTMLEEGSLIDWDESFYVGSSAIDEECADNVGIEYQSASSFF